VTAVSLHDAGLPDCEGKKLKVRFFANVLTGLRRDGATSSTQTGATHAYRVASEEIFGPVLSVMTFRTPEEAFERANNTPYGLSAGVWTNKCSKIFKMVNKLRAGVVWANTYNKFDPTSPFGGYKESGFGREGGLQGLVAYSRLD
jgi:aldehyde dehydrogenase (NAD+)